MGEEDSIPIIKIVCEEYEHDFDAGRPVDALRSGLSVRNPSWTLSVYRAADGRGTYIRGLGCDGSDTPDRIAGLIPCSDGNDRLLRDRGAKKLI